MELTNEQIEDISEYFIDKKYFLDFYIIKMELKLI